MFKTKSKHLITTIMMLTLMLLMMGTVNAATLSGTGIAATMTDVDFGNKIVGYDEECINPTITNTGTEFFELYPINAKVELTAGETTAFRCGWNSGPGAIDVGNSSSSKAYVWCEEGLSVGEHTATLTLYYDYDGSESEYDWEAVTSCTVRVNVELPDITGLSISSDGVVSWDAVDGAEEYYLEFKNWGGFIDASQTQFNLKEFADNKKYDDGSYDFKVTAVDGSRNAISKEGKITYNYESPYEKLATPTNLTWEGFIAKWDAVTGATSYTINLYQNNWPVYGGAVTVTEGATQYDFSTDIRLKKDNEYKFIVTAYAADKIDSNSSEFSPVIEGWFELGTISNVSVSEDGILTWDAYAGADKYSIGVSNFGGNYDETNYDVKERLEFYNKPSDTYTITIYAVNANNIALTKETQIEYDYTYDTIYVRNLSEYEKGRNLDAESTVEKVVLLADIDISSLNAHGNHDAWYLRKDLILDLNGHTLTMSGQVLKLWLYNNDLTFTVMDSSDGKTGKIIQKASNRDFILSISNQIGTNLTDVTVIFDGGTYSVPNNAEFVYHWAKEANTNLIIRNNATFINGDLNAAISNISIETGTFKVDNSNFELSLLYDEMTFADILAENSVAYIKDTETDVETKIASSELVKDYERSTTTEIIVKKELLVVETPEFENANYGYADITEKAISITNKTPDSIQIKSVVASGDKFTVVGTTTPTIAAGATDNTSFSIKPVTGLSVGTYETEVTVTDMNDKEYTATVSFEVEAKDITSTIAIDTIDAQTYTGSEVEPTIVVKDGTTPLTIETDYTVAYENNINRGTATVKIAPVDGSNYTWTGEKTAEFTINPKDITSTITIDAIPDQDFTGSEIEPTIVVKDGTTTLELTTDYTVTYSNNINKGTEAKATLATVSTSNYTWISTVEETFNIVAYAIKESEVTLGSTSEEYTGTDIEPTVTVTVNGTVLTEDTDYTVTYADNINVGTATVTVEGIGNYGGTVEKEFEITKVKLTKPEVNGTYTYTGSSQTAELNDFDPALMNVTNNTRTDAGKQDITVSLKDTTNYAWDDNSITDLTLEFTINPMTIIPVIGTIANQTYTGSAIEPKPTVTGNATELVYGDEYTESYENNINVGTATLKILPVAGSNYTWTVEVKKDFEIVPMTITPTIADITAVTFTNEDITPELVVTGDSKTLAKDTDYTVAYENNKYVGTATAKITAKAGSNYTWTGEITKDFTINPATSELSGNPADVTDSTNTSATVLIGKSLDISTLVTLNPSAYQSEVTFTVTDVGSTGASLDTDGKTLKGATAEGTVTIKASFTGMELNSDSNLEYSPATDLTFYVKVVDKEEVTISGLTYANKVYDGTIVAPTGTLEVSENKVPTNELIVKYEKFVSSWTEITELSANVGKYRVTYSVSDTNENYTGSESYEFEITVKKLTKPTLEGTYTYTGSAQTATLTGFDGTTMEVSNNTRTDAGSQNIEVTLKDTTNYSWDDDTTTALEIPFEIAKEKLTKPTLEGTYTYTGEEQTAVLVNVDNETMNVTNNTRTEVGNQNIEVTLKDTTNYSWDDDTTDALSIPFVISKATPTITLSNLSQKEGSVTAVTYTVTPEVTDGTVKVEYKVSTEEDSAYTETLPTTKGTYTVRVSVAGDTNLEDTQNTATLTITKKSTGGGGGGGSTTTKYTITVKQNDNGAISPETTKVEKGDNQKFEIKANKGYEVEKVLVDGKSVGAVTEYTFEKVKEKHTIEATFKKVEEVTEETWKNPFTDVTEDDWFYEAVKYANENKLFNGVSSTEFGPKVNMTRGMLVTVLYRLEGEPATNRSIPFADVDMSMYYANAISWAKQNNIVNGVDETNFAPNAQISREQLVAILYRYAKAKGMDVSVGEETNILSYDDVNGVSEYAIPAMQWGCGAGIITGRTQSTLAPQGTATRAEVATMLMRFVK